MPDINSEMMRLHEAANMSCLEILELRKRVYEMETLLYEYATGKTDDKDIIDYVRKHLENL